MKQLLKYALLLLWIAFSIFMCYGCTIREYQHDSDPNGTETHYYRSLSLFSDTSADGVRITTPEGVVLEVIKANQEANKIKASALIGTVPVRVGTD